MTIIPRLVATLATCFCISGFGSPLTVSTWGGAHGDVITTEILQPFSVNFDMTVEHKTKGQTESNAGTVPGIVELSLSEAVEACDTGQILLLPLDRLDEIPSDQGVIHDFVPNTLQPCAIGHSLWSTVVAFDKNRYNASEKPHLIADFFDVATFPGRRAIRQSPKALAEWALVASGVALSDIYSALDNVEESWALIDQKLKMIEEHIVWVNNDDEALELIQSGHAAFAMMGSDSLIRNALQQSEQLEVLWDAAVTEMSLWAIPSDTENPEASWKFMQFAASTNNSGRVASFFGYGPVRYSALKLMDRRYQKMLPSWVGNRHSLLWSNSQWWQEESSLITKKFTEWALGLEGKPELALVTLTSEQSSNKSDSIDSLVVIGEEGLRSHSAGFLALGRSVY